jgi:hypothetical protein
MKIPYKHNTKELQLSVHTPRRHKWGVDVQLYGLLTSALEGKWLA